MKIFKGDDTGGRLGKALTITVHTRYDLTNCLIFFNYQGITRKWEGVRDGDTLDLFFSHNETARMSVGTFKGVMFAIDPAGKYRTIDNAIPITVTTSLRDCYGDDHFDVVVGVAVDWNNIVHKPFEGQTIDLSTDDKMLAALGTIIEKLGGTVKTIAILALASFFVSSAFAYDPPVNDKSYTTNGVTYAQRGGLGSSDYVVTNVDAEALVSVKSVNGLVGDVELSAADVGAFPARGGIITNAVGSYTDIDAGRITVYNRYFGETVDLNPISGVTYKNWTFAGGYIKNNNSGTALYFPWGVTGQLAVNSWSSLRSMLTDATTNTNADRESISTNICKIIEPAITNAVIYTRDRFYDAELDVTWKRTVSGGRIFYDVESVGDSTGE